MRSSSSGIPSIVSTRDVGRRPPVPRPPRGHLVGQAHRGEVVVQRPAAGGAQDLLDPAPRDLLHRLAQQAAGRPAEPRRPAPGRSGPPGSRQRRRLGQHRLDLRPVRRAGPRSAPDGGARARRAAPWRGHAARRRRASPTPRRPRAGRPRRPAATAHARRRRATPSLADCTSSCASRSSGWAQVSLIDSTAAVRPSRSSRNAARGRAPAVGPRRARRGPRRRAASPWRAGPSGWPARPRPPVTPARPRRRRARRRAHPPSPRSSRSRARS